MRIAVPLLLILCSAFATGCTQTLVVKDPSTAVRSVKVVEQTPQGARLEVVVDLDNPNAIPLPLVDSHYTLEISGVGVCGMSQIPGRTLPASGRQTVRLPAVFTGDGARVAGAAYNVTGTIVYEPPGEIRKLLTESMVPLPTAAFSGSGKLE